MNIPVRIGMDTAKAVFQLQVVDKNDVVVVRRQFRRAEKIRYFERLPPALVAIESCGSSYHWARLLQSFGHEVKLIPPQYVTACVKRGKNNAADAEALSPTHFTKLNDVHYAEKAALKALKKSTWPRSISLKQAFEDHRVEIEGQIERLVQVSCLTTVRRW